MKLLEGIERREWWIHQDGPDDYIWNKKPKHFNHKYSHVIDAKYVEKLEARIEELNRLVSAIKGELTVWDSGFHRDHTKCIVEIYRLIKAFEREE